MQTKWWGWGDRDRSYPLDRKPQFWPFLEARLGTLPAAASRVESLEAIPLRSSHLRPEHRSALTALVGPDGVSTLPEDRILHAYGKSYRDLVRVRRGEVAHAPDAVVYPRSHDEVQAVLQLALEAGLKVIPFGGGTSVVGGVEVAPKYAENVFLSLDLRRLDQVIDLDAVSRTARLQAGLLGPDLEAKLNARGFTLGHFPQSFEFSTLGGWLATRSAGQQSSRYGKIEDMVVSLKLATPRGTLETPLVPAQATGPSVLQAAVGSEGTLGVITEAVMRVHPLPSTRDFRGFLMPSYEAGIAAIRDLLAHDLRPSLVRLSDEAETETMRVLRDAPPSGFDSWVQRIGKWVLTRGGAIDIERRCLLLLGFEGDVPQVIHRWESARSLLRQHDGLPLGASAGQAWLRSRFELPYLRDTLLDRGVLIDTLETSTEWSKLLPLYRATTEALRTALEATGTPAHVMCHVSHGYHDGASLYFTFAGKQTVGQELEQWEAVKRAATDCLVMHGGALSHHHGVGLDHAPWMPQAQGSLGVEAIEALKAAFDPHEQMNPGKLTPNPLHQKQPTQEA